MRRQAREESARRQELQEQCNAFRFDPLTRNEGERNVDMWMEEKAGED